MAAQAAVKEPLNSGSATAGSGLRRHDPRLWVPALGLAAVCLLALALRSLGFEWVFVGDSDVVLLVGDGQYHARRAFYSYLNFPAVLVRDFYINYPDGASVPDPPLLDLLMGGVARLLARSQAGFEGVMAWWSPVSGALTPIPVYFACRCVAGRGTALTAAAFFAVLPISVTSSQVGNADHHAAVSLLGGILLAVCLALVHSDARGVRLAPLAVGLAILRIVMPLSWSGSLLYTGIADGLILLAATLSGRRDLLAVVGLSALSASVVLSWVVLFLPEPVGGPYSAVALSRLQVLAALAAAAVAALAWALEARFPNRSWRLRLAHCSAGVVVAAALLLSIPGLLRGLGLGLGFVGPVESSTTATFELLPLFPILGRPAGQPAALYFGHFAYLIPILPLALLLGLRRAARGREALLVLLVWASLLGSMTLWQVRHGADFAVSACIVLALALARLGSWLHSRGRLPRRVVPIVLLALVVISLWMPVRDLYLPKLQSSLAALAGSGYQGDRALASPSGSLSRFLQEVRRLTPETSGYFDAEERPEYGILCSPNLGHALNHVARRASPANGFQHMVGVENFSAARRFFALRQEAKAVSIAKQLQSRYVVTMSFPGIRRGSIEGRLHIEDGLGAGAARLEHFRLVTEGPRGGAALGALFGLPSSAALAPYKLFEIVSGAVIEARAEAGAPVSALLRLRTPLGRRLLYRVAGVADPEGIARLRVPYPTGGVMPVRSLGPYRVRIAGAVHEVKISGAQVRNGATVPVPISFPESLPSEQ